MRTYMYTPICVHLCVFFAILIFLLMQSQEVGALTIVMSGIHLPDQNSGTIMPCAKD